VKIVLASLYTLLMLAMSLFSYQTLALTLLYLRYRRQPYPTPPEPPIWPKITVQLPIYNEKLVIERLITAVCALNYPDGALSIQVLDDSSDETRIEIDRLVQEYREIGINIQTLRRENRTGFKGGALAQGLCVAPGELIAIFDADFLPPPDFLYRVVPYLVADPGLGMVQVRWGHLNPDFNVITRGQALALDGHFFIIQTARSRAGLLFNFNGSGGIWRKTCIEDAGGWSGDTLTEDLDLSYRAQLAGWRMAYLPDIVVPAEIPPLILSYKQQQYRWARGGIQSLRKLGGTLWRAQISWGKRLAGLLHLASYLAHPFMLLFLIICLPLVLWSDVHLTSMKWLLPAGFGPPMLVLLSQWRKYPDWKRRFLFFPFQILLSIGMGLNNTLAVISALNRDHGHFSRTAKFSVLRRTHLKNLGEYRLPIDWTLGGELFLTIYALLTLILAWNRLPELVLPLLTICAGFGFVSSTTLWQGFRTR